MSKNIIIQQSGTPIHFSADQIQTALAGRGSAGWVPREDAEMAKVVIHKNGTYTAEALGVNGIMEADVDDKGGTAIIVTRRDLVGSLPTLNPSIQEGGAPFNFSTHAVKVAAQGGGDALFVPADMPMGAKVITRSGKYKASSDGLYAWNSLRVNIDDGGGGGGGGGFDEPVDHIAVTTPPTHTEYGDRAYIVFDGIVVTAYNAQGTALGTIPFDELIFPVTIADITQTHPGHGGEVVGDTLVFSSAGVTVTVHDAPPDLDAIFYVYLGTWPNCCLISSMPASVTIEVTGIGVETGSYYTLGLDRDTGLYYAGIDFEGYDELNPWGWPRADDYPTLLAMYDGGATGNIQTIPVQWARDGDGRILESSFDITVIPAGGHGDD